MQQLKTIVKFLWLKLDDHISGGTVVDRGKETDNMPFMIMRNIKDLEQRIKIAKQFFCIWMYVLFNNITIILLEILDSKEGCKYF